jgi:hypothetical protein
MGAIAAQNVELVRRRTPSVQTYARVAGVLLLLSFVAGGFGEAFVPSKLIVWTDAAATAANLKSNDLMFRWSFIAYLVEACCDIALALIFYALLKPIHKYVSLLAAFFGLLSTATFAVAEMFYFAPTLVLGGSGSLENLSPDQLNTLVLLSLKLFGLGGWIFTVFLWPGLVFARLSDVSFGLFSEVSRHPHGSGRTGIYEQEFRRGPRARVSIWLACAIDRAWEFAINRLAARQGG